VRGLSAVDSVISGSCRLTSAARSSPSPGIFWLGQLTVVKLVCRTYIENFLLFFLSAQIRISGLFMNFFRTTAVRMYRWSVELAQLEHDVASSAPLTFFHYPTRVRGRFAERGVSRLYSTSKTSARPLQDLYNNSTTPLISALQPLHLQFVAAFRKVMAWKFGDCDVRTVISKQIMCIIKEEDSCGLHVTLQ
jgi:hypothetical protein